ncbi:MAG: hypothetical protein A4E55_00631 [Pelotomaculum sp. PtaU1.Bin035]|nr:MAG: hypothetical protein A4E55_00631 [Pelotomaculum sp. PtaU1.Bin035]
MSYKYFVKQFTIIIIFFLIFHIIIYGFTREALSLPDKFIKRSIYTGRHEPLQHVEVTAFGDLARLSYLYRLGVRREVVDTSDEKGFLNKKYGENLVYPVLTVGDSFMLCNGDDGRFPILLQNQLNTNCYNAAANGVQDPFSFLQSDLIKNTKVLVWESVERNISSDSFNVGKIDFYYTESKKKNDYVENWDRKKTYRKQLEVVNSSNIKFLVNNLWYSITGKPALDKVDIVKLKNGRELMYFQDDLISFNKTENFEDVCQIAEFISYINTQLKAKGITLIFLAVPDKYNAYYGEIVEEQKIKNDPRFIERLTSELQNRNVIAVNLIDPFRNEINEGRDVYHFDDTHWNNNGAEIAAELVAREIKKRGLLD